MARQKSEFVSAAYKMTRVFEALANAVLDAGGSDEDLRRIETEGDLRRELATLIAHKQQVPKTPAPTVTSFPLTVSYDLSVEALVAEGKYDYANPNITAKNFPSTGTGTSEKEAFLVHFNRFISTEEDEKGLDKLGFRPGNLQELLCLGIRRPDLQREFPVVETGSRWQSPRGRWRCAYLDGFADYRNLYLCHVLDGWDGHYRFLAFRK